MVGCKLQVDKGTSKFWTISGCGPLVELGDAASNHEWIGSWKYLVPNQLHRICGTAPGVGNDLGKFCLKLVLLTTRKLYL